MCVEERRRSSTIAQVDNVALYSVRLVTCFNFMISYMCIKGYHHTCLVKVAMNPLIVVYVPNYLYVFYATNVSTYMGLHVQNLIS